MAGHVTAASNFLIPNGTFIAEVIAFAIILFVLARYVYPPINKAMRQRQDIIQKQIEDAEAARERLAEAQAEYQRALNEARTQGAQIRDEARADAAAIRDDVLAKAREESDRIIAAGRHQLEAERAATVRQLRNEVGTLAVDLASRIVGESLEDEARQRGTVDRFLSELNAGTPARGGS